MSHLALRTLKLHRTSSRSSSAMSRGSKALQFGLTAEQMVTKFETDHNAPGISKLLVSEMRPQDVRRLLIDVLPPRYFENAEHLDPDDPDEPSEERLARLQVLYRAAYDSASEDVQKAATKKYVSALREDSGSRVEIYDEAFFRSPDLTHLSRAERELVIATHLLDRLKTRSTTSNSLLESCVGMSPYLNANQFRRFIDAYIRVIAYDAGISRRRIAREGLVTEYANHTTTEQDQRISKRLDEWVTTLRQREATNALSRIEKLRSELFPPDDGDIPFATTRTSHDLIDRTRALTNLDTAASWWRLIRPSAQRSTALAPAAARGQARMRPTSRPTHQTRQNR